MADQVYTAEQRAAAMRAAGFPEDVIPTGVAVSLAESFNGLGINNNPGVEYSVGPWQINLLAHHNITEAQALDLNYSTNYAYQLWSAQGWQPWGAYTSGAYQKYLSNPDVSDTAKPVEPRDIPPVSLEKGATTSSVSSSVSGFQFPDYDLGILGKHNSNGLFKVAITLGAMVIVFYAFISITSGEK